VKSKMWLISLVLAVVLVVGVVLPGCAGPAKEWVHSPYTDEKLELKLAAPSEPLMVADMAKMIETQLEDFGIDVELDLIESGTYWGSILYYPMDHDYNMLIAREDPSLDPWSNWIWLILADPYEWGYEWAPTFWYSEEHNELYLDLFFGENYTDTMYAIQELVNEELPMYMLARFDFLAGYRTDRWENWKPMLGGLVSWMNMWSLQDVHRVGGDGVPKTLVIGALTDVDSLNMCPWMLTYTDIGCIYSNWAVYECLATYSYAPPGQEANAYNFTPRLAVGYDVTYEDKEHPVTHETWEDVQVWTWHLREGVQWHDGDPFTAYDVEWSAKNVWSPWDPGNPVTWSTYYESGDEEDLVWWIEVVDAHTIQFIYEQPLTEEYTPSCLQWEPVVPKHVFGPEGAEDPRYKDDWKEDPGAWDGHGIGTGPFKLAEYKPGQYLRLVRNDNWWGADDPDYGLPEAEEIWFRIYGSFATELLALEGGDIDVIMGDPIPVDLKDDLEAEENIDVLELPGLTCWYLGFNFYTDNYHPYDNGTEEVILDPAENPMHDKVLRQAIAYAIDMEAIIAALGFQDYGAPIDSWVYRESPKHNPDLEMYSYNPSKARAMLEAAGYYWE